MDARTLLLLSNEEKDACRVFDKSMMAKEVGQHLFPYIHILQISRLEDVQRVAHGRIYIQFSAA